MQLNLLRFVYRGILTGMPLITYNPITKSTLYVPFTINPKSTYVNYKLSPSQVSEIQGYIHTYDPQMEMTPVKLLSDEPTPSYYLSLNMYNCSSPIFYNDNQDITRFEINTYIRKWNDTAKEYDKGTVILDYTSNALSMDPIHYFKGKEDLSFVSEETSYVVNTLSLKHDIDFHIQFIPWHHIPKYKKLSKRRIHEELVEYSDAIYYKNGIYDKLYYDSSLVKAIIEEPYVTNETLFQYRGMVFWQPESVFYFTRDISFVGGMWDNVFSHPP